MHCPRTVVINTRFSLLSYLLWPNRCPSFVAEGYSEDPDYQFVKDLFKDLFDSLGFKDVDHFKWEDELKHMLSAVERGINGVKLDDVSSPSSSS
jgi:hypothetical protein